MSQFLNGFKPMLSAGFTVDDVSVLKSELNNLTYPVLTSPKIDGIRVICHPELGPVTRSLKPVPNKFIREYLSHPWFRYMDGEVVIGEPFGGNVMQRSTSGVMSEGGTPDFTFWVFDYIESARICPFSIRTADAAQKVQEALLNTRGPIRVRHLTQFKVSEPWMVLDDEETAITKGYEGLMVRSPSALYKFGRSTLKQQGLIKLKRWADAEARITGYEELQRNNNEAFTNERGYTERSSHKANMIPGGTLGALYVKCDLFEEEFSVGSGFDDAMRAELWAQRDQLIGKQITFKYFPYSIKIRPRHPIFKALRPQE